MTDEEINKAVHKAMGAGCWHEGAENLSGYYHCPKCVGIIPLKYSTSLKGLNPDYVSNISEAMRFVAKLIASGWDFILSMETKKLWDAEFYSMDGKDTHERYDPSPAKAICLAGLSALDLQPEPSTTTAEAEIAAKINADL